MKTSRFDKDGDYGDVAIGSVGAWLKNAREERGATLDEVANITRIGKSYLEALEEGAAAKLPSQAYTRGFIRLYATHLGLSPEEALSILDAKPVAAAETTATNQIQPAPARIPFRPSRRSLSMLAILPLALVAGYFLFKPTPRSSLPAQNSRLDTAPPPRTVPTTATSQEQIVPKSAAAAPPEPRHDARENQGIVLRLKAVSDGKIHITIDDSISQEYELVTGDIVEWKAENTFMLDLDNGASVEGELNGVRLNALGEPGKAAHLVLKADGIHKE